VPFALNKPRAIFKGLEREGHETSYCYVAQVARRFISDNHSIPVDNKWVFLVFVSSSLEVFWWRFEKSVGNSGLPENYETRFTKQIWPTKA
jgi:hypothetical protein